MNAIHRPQHRHRLRVYWEDTDAGGIVFHANYIKFAERGRTEWIRDLGVGQAELADGGRGHAFAVAHIDIDFTAPARLDDELEVVTELTGVGGASLQMRQAINRLDDGVQVVCLNVRLVYISLDDGRPVRIPAEMRQTMLGLVSERQD